MTTAHQRHISKVLQFSSLKSPTKTNLVRPSLLSTSLQGIYPHPAADDSQEKRTLLLELAAVFEVGAFLFFKRKSEPWSPGINTCILF